jgi:hypothetical protein
MCSGGHVWTVLDEPLSFPPDPVEFHDLELGEWVAGPTIQSTIGLAATTENFRDVAHFPFVRPSPISYEECTIFWGVANDVGFSGMSVEAAMEAEYAVCLEDIPIVSDLDPSEVPFDGEAVEVSVPSDRFTLAYRKAFLEFVRAAVDEASTNGRPQPTASRTT